MIRNFGLKLSTKFQSGAEVCLPASESSHDSGKLAIGLFRFFNLALILLCISEVLSAQDLSPRAYVITPIHSNAIILTYAYYGGNVLLDGTVPGTGATASINNSRRHLISFAEFLWTFGQCDGIAALRRWQFPRNRGRRGDQRPPIRLIGLRFSILRKPERRSSDDCRGYAEVETEDHHRR